MMKYVQIKEITSQEGETLYKVNAIMLESSNGEKKKKIPHPLGTETMIFKSLEKAKEAVILAGFEFVLPDGTLKQDEEEYKILPYDKKIFDALMNQSEDSNPNIVAAAVSSLSEINHPDCLKLFIEKLGEDNDVIRQNSIEAVLKYGNRAIPQVLEAIKSDNWVQRNSAIICLQHFCEDKETDISKIIDALLDRLKDNNPIVKCSVIKALGVAYKNYRKR